MENHRVLPWCSPTRLSQTINILDVQMDAIALLREHEPELKKTVRCCKDWHLRLFCTRRAAAGQRCGRARHVPERVKDIRPFYGLHVLSRRPLRAQSRSCDEGHDQETAQTLYPWQGRLCVGPCFIFLTISKNLQENKKIHNGYDIRTVPQRPQDTGCRGQELRDHREATKNLPEDLKSRYPGVAWKPVAGLRDIMAHGYYRID